MVMSNTNANHLVTLINSVDQGKSRTPDVRSYVIENSSLASESISLLVMDAAILDAGEVERDVLGVRPLGGQCKIYKSFSTSALRKPKNRIETQTFP